ncbi:ABC transporter substrate-binding protein [Variovorax humicola]|uniref:ABC transporter substrate-binding protein n=1 Tax=Variovorax humicola TaxID=1769758 RepID=A0ABU8W5B4_9BURK
MKSIPTLRRIAIAVAALALCAGAQAAPQCGSDKPLRFAGITWESGQFYTSLIRTILESGYGCKTEVVNGSTAATETALVSGDLQLWVEQWNRTDIIKKGVEGGKIKLVGDLLADGGATEGFFVPDYVVNGDAKRGIEASAPDLRTVADMPKYKELFADDEELGKGRFLNCPTGWDCEKINNQKFKAYKLDSSYTNFRAGTGSALDAAVSSAVERGKPVLFYYWSPASLMGKYKFVQIKEPDYNQKCWETIKDPRAKEVCPSATPNSRLTVGMSTALIQSDPEVVSLIEKVQVKPETINASIARMAGEKKVPADVVTKEFLKANPAVWSAWVTPAAAAKLTEALK